MARVVVTEQDGKRHVSSVPLADDEAEEFVATDAAMHRAAGWTVNEIGDGCFVAIMVKRRGRFVRTITRMVTTTAYDPSVSS